MNAKNFDIKSALLESGKKEFLRCGFEKASLRTICRNAKVTTGAFYSYFSKKEDLFNQLVEPMLTEYRRVYDHVMERELEDLTLSSDNEARIVGFVVSHRDEFRLLFDCSDGTQYSGFKEELLEGLFMQGYQNYFDRYSGKSVDPDLVRIILNMKFQQYMELIYGEYSMEKIKKLTAWLSVYSEAGFKALMKSISNEGQ
jgi:AcrR family transcriptional regulator